MGGHDVLPIVVQHKPALGDYMPRKTDVDGRVMWEYSSGERVKDVNADHDMYGWHKVDVNGQVMWESPDGERLRG